MQEKPKEKTTATKATEAARKVRPLVKNMYARALKAKAEGRPVAYCMVTCQYEEVLHAMGVTPIWTENYAGLCAAKRAAEPYILKAESDGFSNVLCGYARTGIGFDAIRQELGDIPEGAPDGGMAKPDMLLGCSSVCDPRYKWYQALGRYLDTPCYCFDVVVPPIDIDPDEAQDYYVKYQTEQFRGLVGFLEKVTGKKLDYDRLWEVIKVSDETAKVWYEAYELRKAVPAPMPSQDHFSAFVPAYFMIGEQVALDFYRDLYQEIKQRVENGVGAIPNEKYRLLWAGGLPPWHTLGIFNYFETFGAVFCMEVSYRPWDPVEVSSHIKDPLEYIALRGYKRATYRHKKARLGSGDPRVELILEYIDGYKIDGMLMHQAKSCRATTLGQIHFKNMVQEHVKTPTMFMESDIVDVRDYSEAQTKMQVDAFMEAVASFKEGRAH